MAEVIVITGGSRGIGRACIEQAVAKGWTVMNMDLRSPTELLENEQFLETDLTDRTSIEQSFAAALSGNALVGLVNNAGASISHSLEESSPDDFATLVPLNLIGPMLCAKLAAEAMKQSGWGRIVNISSRVVLGKERRTAYAATKGGLAAMSRVWALELAQHGITVNTVGPGPIATELFRKVNPDDSPQTQRILETIPVGRLGQPEDVANAVMFFLDRASGFVTGQTIYVCGGLSVGSEGS